MHQSDEEKIAGRREYAGDFDGVRNGLQIGTEEVNPKARLSLQ
jgi:hypothetical protein